MVVRKKWNVFLILTDGSKCLENAEPLPKYKAERLATNIQYRLLDMEYEGQQDFPRVVIEVVE